MDNPDVVQVPEDEDVRKTNDGINITENVFSMQKLDPDWVVTKIDARIKMLNENVLEDICDNLSKEYREYIQQYDKKLKEFEDLQSKILTGFYNIFGKSIIALVNDQLVNKQFRRAWWKIQTKFTIINGDGKPAQQLIKLMTSLKFDIESTPFRNFIDYFKLIVERLKILGMEISLPVQANYFFDCMKKVRVKDLDIRNLIMKYEMIDKKDGAYFMEMFNRFDQHFSDFLAANKTITIIGNQRDRESQPEQMSFAATHQTNKFQSGDTIGKGNRTVVTNNQYKFNQNVTCGKCNKPGFTTERHECDVTCSFCGQKGHGDYRCFSNPDGNGFRQGRKPRLPTYQGITQAPSSMKRGGVEVTNPEFAKYNKKNKVGFE